MEEVYGAVPGHGKYSETSQNKRGPEDTEIENDLKRVAVGLFETEFSEEASEQRPE